MTDRQQPGFTDARRSGTDGPLVSVVITCFNQRRFIGEAIQSALNQTHPHVEVLVVDDGSTDDSPAVIASYGSVHSIRQQNQGHAAARNAGLARSRGACLVFLDGDDRLLPRAVEIGVARLREDLSLACVSGAVRLVSADGALLSVTFGDCPGSSQHYVGLLRGNYIWTAAAVMYQRWVFERTPPFLLAADPCADLELHFRIARQWPIGCHDEQVVDYRQHDTNVTRDFGLMLKREVQVRRWQWPHVRGVPERVRAYRTGMRSVQDDYGDGFATQVRAFASGHRWVQVIRGGMLLALYHPRGLLKVIGRGRARSP